jgi:hypothetical protein
METLLGIVLSSYFWLMLAVAIASAGAFGFFSPLKVSSMDVLALRRFFRTVLIVAVIGHFIFTVYWPAEAFDTEAFLSEEEKEQAFLPEEGKDWLTFWANTIIAYFAVWALVSGLEKRVHNPFVFFNLEFYQKVEKPAKNKK